MKELIEDMGIADTQLESKSGRGSFTVGQTWGALRKAWRAYKIAKVAGEKEQMKEHAVHIRTLQKDLGVQVASFPDLGLE